MPEVVHRPCSPADGITYPTGGRHCPNHQDLVRKSDGEAYPSQWQRSIQANSHAGAQRHAFVRTAQKRCRLVPHFEYADEDLAPFVAAGRDRGRWKRRRIAPKANTLWPKLIVQNLGTIHRYGSATYGSAKGPQNCLRQLRCCGFQARE